MVNSQAYELKFISVAAKKDAPASACKDIEWATYTCTFVIKIFFDSKF
jgi:hypothetical protein